MRESHSALGKRNYQKQTENTENFHFGNLMLKWSRDEKQFVYPLPPQFRIRDSILAVPAASLEAQGPAGALIRGNCKKLREEQTI